MAPVLTRDSPRVPNHLDQMDSPTGIWKTVGKIGAMLTRALRTESSVDLLHTNGVLIVMYHSTPGPAGDNRVSPRWAMPVDRFTDQMRWISKHCSPVSLGDAVDAIVAGRPTPQRAICVTFDDGYLNNLLVAAPILQEFSIPATIYLATGAIERGEAQIVDRLRWLLGTARPGRIAIRLNQETEIPVDTTSGAARRDSLARLDAASTILCRNDRDSIYATLIRELGAQDLDGAGLTMTPDDVRLLSTQYPFIEIGAHSVDHIDLTWMTRAQVDYEITTSMARLVSWTGKPVRHFACPYNRSSPFVEQRLRANGLVSAAALDPMPLFLNVSQRWSIPRFDTTKFQWPHAVSRR